jgi:23S rRNA pseudouridine1911/1915/1917 synthase
MTETLVNEGTAPQPWRVPAEATGERLDAHIAHHLDVPRNQVQRWIRDGHVTVNGTIAPRPSLAVSVDDTIECHPPRAVEERISPETGDLVVLFEDREIVVLDKPPGLTVHPGAGRATGTLAHRLLARYPEIAGVGGAGRPGIVHRLDLGTSGAIVIARTAAAYQALSSAFLGREVEKRYLAIVFGTAKPPSGTIDAPIGRHPERRQEMAVRTEHRGRPAITIYRTLAAAGGLSLWELDLRTGRTHQIRVHAKHLGHPLVGDPTYGEARWKGLPKARQVAVRDFPRPALHAWRLGFTHPETHERKHFEAPVPHDLVDLWEQGTGEPFPKLSTLEIKDGA